MGSIAWNPPPLHWDNSSSSGDEAGKLRTTTGGTTGGSTNSAAVNHHSKVYLAYDGRMTLHRPVPKKQQEDANDENDSSDDDEDVIMERPERVQVIYQKLQSMPHASYKFFEIPCIPASREAITLVHSEEHYENMCDTAYMSDDELIAMGIPNDLFFGRDTFFAARMAVGGVLECVKATTSPSSRSKYAIAVVRPPGHHALKNQAMGFCYFNNVAIAAKHAIVTGRAHRVFILDWDIHHGNGIQDLTYDDPSIFYCSIHRGGTASSVHQYFYPGTGHPTQVGKAGTNLNIAWPVGGMGDEEYNQAFQSLVLPVLQSFRADLILVACGLDAVQGDLIGDCGLSHDMYHHMTRMLMEAAPDVPIVMALEGGYNMDHSASCMERIAMALLGEPLPSNPDSRRIKAKRKVHNHLTATHMEAMHSIQRSSMALQRKGGTCMCGCHYKCKHCTKGSALPLKKRKTWARAKVVVMD